MDFATPTKAGNTSYSVAVQYEPVRHKPIVDSIKRKNMKSTFYTIQDIHGPCTYSIRRCYPSVKG